MTASPGNLLVLGDYPVGYANGIGETLANLLERFPDDRLFQLHPSHATVAPPRARGTARAFYLPRPPDWLPAGIGAAYAPLLKVRQVRAEQRVFELAAALIREQRIDAVLTYPVTPWILFAAVRLRRAFPRVRFVFYVLDDWEGHHTCFGLPFTPQRRAALDEIVRTADVRFACSYEMQADYERRFGNAWLVLHKGVKPGDVAPRTLPPQRPWRILYAGGLNVFRADAVAAFVEGLSRFRERSGHAATLTLLGEGPNALATPEVASRDFVHIEPWVDPAECRRRRAEADLLYLPLSLQSRLARIANLAMPAKFSEYLAAGRPVIFHVPAASEVQHLAEGAGLPLTLNTADPEAICETLMQLDRDGVDLASYAERARALLAREFDEDQLQQRLVTACFAPQIARAS